MHGEFYRNIIEIPVDTRLRLLMTSFTKRGIYGGKISSIAFYYYFRLLKALYHVFGIILRQRTWELNLTGFAMLFILIFSNKNQESESFHSQRKTCFEEFSRFIILPLRNLPDLVIFQQNMKSLLVFAIFWRKTLAGNLIFSDQLVI